MSDIDIIKRLRERRERAQEAMKKVCEKCGRTGADHKLSEIIFCLYEGTPTKAGTPFDRSDANAIVKRMGEKLLS